MRLAFMMVNTVPGQVERVLEKIKEINGVEEVYMVYGVYDIVVEVKAKTASNIKEKVFQIQKINQVRSTLTMIVMA